MSRSTQTPNSRFRSLLTRGMTLIAAGGVVVTEAVVLSYDDEEENDR